MACLIMAEPYRGFAKTLVLFYPDALKAQGRDPERRTGRSIPRPRLKQGVRVEPGAVIGPEAYIGRRHDCCRGAASSATACMWGAIAISAPMRRLPMRS